VSTRDDKVQVADCLHCGAADYLVKPLRRNELGTMWAHVWRRWVRDAAAMRRKAELTSLGATFRRWARS
jgi:response regulator of citrate/malate metabolism